MFPNGLTFMQDALEAHAYYNGMAYGSPCRTEWYAYKQIAEAYLMRLETLNGGTL